MKQEEEKQQVREEISPPDRGAFDKFIKEIVVQLPSKNLSIYIILDTAQ